MAFPRWLSRLERDYINKGFRYVAGVGPYADLEHVGRRSGTVRHTPVRAFGDGQTIRIGLNHADVDWCKNVMAAGRCRVRFRGRTYDIIEPRVVAIEACANKFPPVERWVFRHLIHTGQVLELPIESRPVASSR